MTLFRKLLNWTSRVGLAIAGLWSEILSWSGVAAIVAGLWIVHPAAACVGAGGVLLFLGVLKSRKDIPR